MMNKITCNDDFVKLETWPGLLLGLLFLLFPFLFSYFYISDYLRGNVDIDNFLFVIGIFIAPLTLILLAIASIKKTAVFYKALLVKSGHVFGIRVTNKTFDVSNFKSISLALTAAGTSLDSGATATRAWLVVCQNKAGKHLDAKLIDIKAPKEKVKNALVQASKISGLSFSGEVDGVRSPWGVEYDK